MRREDKNNMSPILRDLSRGSGGLGSGWFTTNSADNLPFDPTSELLATEAGDILTTELETPLRT